MTTRVLAGVGVAAAVLAVALAAGGPEPERASSAHQACWDVRQPTAGETGWPTTRQVIRINRCTGDTWRLMIDQDARQTTWWKPILVLPGLPE